MANISIARGNILKKIPIQGELFYDYQTEGIYIGTGTTTSDWKRIGGFDSLVLKGLLPSTVTTVTALNEYAHMKAVDPAEANKEGYNGLKAGDAYIITKDFTDKNWKSGDLVIWTGDISATAPDAIAMETASELISEGWFYINCGLVDASRVAFDTTGEDVKNTKLYKLVIDNDQLDMQSIQQILELLLRASLFYDGEITDTKDISTTDGVMQFYLGPNVNEYTDAAGNKIALKKSTLIFRQLGVSYYIPLGVASAEALEGSFTNTTRTADVDMTKTPVATKNANDEATTITHATDVMTIQQMLDWLHETKADLQSNGKIPLSQIPATLVGGLQYKGIITIGTDTTKDSYTAEEFATLIKEKFQTGVDDNNDDAADPIDAGDYVVFSGSEATGGTDFEGSKVIIGDVTYNSGDWAIYDGTSFSKMEGSAAVDNINGLKAAVEIAGYSIDNIHGDTISNDEDGAVHIVNVSVDNKTHSIRISTPRALQQRGPMSSGQVIISDIGLWVKDSELGVRAHRNKYSSTKLTGKTKDNSTIEVEFPFLSCKMVGVGKDLNGNYYGNEYYIPKFNQFNSLVDSHISDKNNTIILGAGVDLGTQLHYNYKLGLLSTYYYDFAGAQTYTGHFVFPHMEADAKGTYPTADDPATLLANTSVIDCGEWL